MTGSPTAPCVVCGRLLRNVFDQDANQPSDATAFHTAGHYGSTVFDPMDGSELEINVCDPCLAAARDQGRVLISRPRTMVTCGGAMVGWARAEKATPVVWTAEHDSHAAPSIEVVRADIGDTAKHPNVDWLPGAVDWAHPDN